MSSVHLAALSRRIFRSSILKGATALPPSFRPYRPADQDSCLALFDANCPAFFAPNERADYLAFLQGGPAGYEVCLLDGRLAGAFGLSPSASGEGRLKWILLHPQLQGRGLGSAIMARVLEKSRASGVLIIRIATSHKSRPSSPGSARKPLPRRRTAGDPACIASIWSFAPDPALRPGSAGWLLMAWAG